LCFHFIYFFTVILFIFIIFIEYFTSRKAFLIRIYKYQIKSQPEMQKNDNFSRNSLDYYFHSAILPLYEPTVRHFYPLPITPMKNSSQNKIYISDLPTFWLCIASALVLLVVILTRISTKGITIPTNTPADHTASLSAVILGASGHQQTIFFDRNKQTVVISGGLIVGEIGGILGSTIDKPALNTIIAAGTDNHIY
jgi:hypothetical protein